MINGWYIAAVVCGAAALYFAYMGSQHDSNRSTARLESQLQDLGTDIQELRQAPATPEKAAQIEKANEEYQALAKDYFGSRDLRAAQEEARTAQEQVEDLQRVQVAETYLRTIGREAEQLAAAYNDAAGQVVLKTSSEIEPKKLAEADEEHFAHVLLEFDGPRFWGVRITTYPDRTRAIQFLRLVSPDGSSEYEKLNLTNDSINLVLGDDNFWVSLNSNISDAVKANVADGLTLVHQPLNEIEGYAATLLRRIIEFELLPNRS